ncbi:urease accessory protein UreD [Sulfobacillus sp. hq2]|uniref:urease accessory protein UreD n=1 Tax=Sulfobacillus TaxID=28033 RepID=UPI000CD1F737|nr:urease accessory protein UreD [Sulfobacillus sp. hq2]POB09888.1 hypothetical protein CO251_13415 [Sulfobacillus sp. hq2]
MGTNRQWIHAFPDRVEVYAEPPLHLFVLRQRDPAYVVAAELGGILEDDHWETEITVEPGAQLVVVQQAATKIFSMPDGSGRHDRRIHVKDHATLVMVPGLFIPFKDANYSQTMVCTVGERSRLMTGEQIVAGRIASGEAFGFQSFSSTVTVHQDGALWPSYHSRQVFEPARVRLQQQGYWGSFQAWGELLAVGWKANGVTTALPQADILPGPYGDNPLAKRQENQEIYWGASPIAGGMLWRMLADDGATVERHLIAVMKRVAWPEMGEPFMLLGQGGQWQ